MDATFNEDVYCVQCSYRLPNDTLNSGGSAIGPELQKQPTIYRPAKITSNEQEVLLDNTTILCPRCDSDDLSKLGKLRIRDHTCYRCRRCGHIFSPREKEADDYTEAM